MNVYRVSATAKPVDSEFEHFATLVTASRRALSCNFFGIPYGKKWMPLELEISMPLYPIPDFFSFAVGTFVCNQRALEATGPDLGLSGELLPVKISEQTGNFFLFNCTN